LLFLRTKSIIASNNIKV